MKHLIKSTIVLLCLALPTIYACSQVPPPPGGLARLGPPGPGGSPPSPPGGLSAAPGEPAGHPLQQLLRIKGALSTYTANDHNEYDGFTLQNSGQTLAVRFPAHMGSQLMAAAKAGASIEVQGFYETTPEGLNVFHLVNATAGGQTIYDTPPTEPAIPPTETIQPFSGTISDLRRDPQGMPNGILLSGNLIVELPPGIYDQLQTYLKSGATVSGSGSRITPPAGVVLAQNTRTIHPQTLTINGQTYMVR